MMNQRVLLFSGLFLLAVLFSSCGTRAGQNLFAPPTPTATPTPTPGSDVGAAVVDLLAQEAYIRLTQQVIDGERIKVGAQMTATQQVVEATATQQKHNEDAQATQRAGYATQVAWNVTVEAGKAHDTATAQAAINYATQTAVVQGTATQMAVLGLTATVSAAQTATPAAQTQQAPIMWAEGTAIAAKAESAKLTADRERMTNNAMAWGPIIAFALLLGGFMFYLWKKSQVGVISDERGNVRVVMVGNNALNPDLMFGPVIRFLRGDVVSPALGVSPDVQAQTVRQNNIVRAIAALPPGNPNQNGMKLLGNMNQGGVSIQIVQPGQLGAIRDELDDKLAQEVNDD